jgi:hypothetical protein
LRDQISNISQTSFNFDEILSEIEILKSQINKSDPFGIFLSSKLKGRINKLDNEAF